MEKVGLASVGVLVMVISSDIFVSVIKDGKAIMNFEFSAMTLVLLYRRNSLTENKLEERDGTYETL